jgi:hypothetical protein
MCPPVVTVVLTVVFILLACYIMEQRDYYAKLQTETAALNQESDHVVFNCTDTPLTRKQIDRNRLEREAMDRVTKVFSDPCGYSGMYPLPDRYHTRKEEQVVCGNGVTMMRYHCIVYRHVYSFVPRECIDGYRPFRLNTTTIDDTLQFIPTHCVRNDRQCDHGTVVDKVVDGVPFCVVNKEDCEAPHEEGLTCTYDDGACTCKDDIVTTVTRGDIPLTECPDEFGDCTLVGGMCKCAAVAPESKQK